VSKLVTATAVLQLHERGKLDLDADVSRYLPFPVRHPASDEPITARQLLTHTAGFEDSDVYGTTYACGDPKVSLEDWLRSYLVPPILELLFAEGAKGGTISGRSAGRAP
jgi:CubicO group peptidase (beta-lactamase class C family)